MNPAIGRAERIFLPIKARGGELCSPPLSYGYLKIAVIDRIAHFNPKIAMGIFAF